MATATYTKTGAKATTPAKLNKAIFGVEVKNHELLKQAYVAYMANGRGNNAVVLKRGEVRGGGRKPWKQKGTGRARFGSIRVPIWRGGGITFGPTGQENYTKRMSVVSKRQALRQALSLANTENKLAVIEDFKFTGGKTSEAVKLLNKLDAVKSVLLVVDNKSDDTVRATNNLSEVKLVQANYLNVFDIMNADSIIMTTSAVAKVSEWLGDK